MANCSGFYPHPWRTIFRSRNFSRGQWPKHRMPAEGKRLRRERLCAGAWLPPGTERMMHEDVRTFNVKDAAKDFLTRPRMRRHLNGEGGILETDRPHNCESAVSRGWNGAAHARRAGFFAAVDGADRKRFVGAGAMRAVPRAGGLLRVDGDSGIADRMFRDGLGEPQGRERAEETHVEP